MTSVPRIWLKAFWGFDPTEEGYLGWTKVGARRRFLSMYEPGDLVLIYGADASETAKEDRRQVLGLLEVEPSEIVDRTRLSPIGMARKDGHGWSERWTFAVPVRRAWRVNRRIDVRYAAPDTYVHERARVLASMGDLMSPREVEGVMTWPVTPLSVFGEPPLPPTSEVEVDFQTAYSPSRGVTPTFGRRTSEIVDGPCQLYAFALVGEVNHMLGGKPYEYFGKVLIKIGYSNNVKRRCEELNSGFPPAGSLRWKVHLASRSFPGAEAAKSAEDHLKALLAANHRSLGGEFFLCEKRRFDRDFSAAAAPVAFKIAAV